MPFTIGHKLAPGGRRPGAGRKKLGIRELCAKSFEERIPTLCEMADSEDNRPADRIAAIKELARVGVPAQHEVMGKDGGPIQTEDSLARIIADPATSRIASSLARSLACKPSGNGQSAN